MSKWDTPRAYLIRSKTLLLYEKSKRVDDSELERSVHCCSQVVCRSQVRERDYGVSRHSCLSFLAHAHPNRRPPGNSLLGTDDRAQTLTKRPNPAGGLRVRHPFAHSDMSA